MSYALAHSTNFEYMFLCAILWKGIGLQGNVLPLDFNKINMPLLDTILDTSKLSLGAIRSKSNWIFFKHCELYKILQLIYA